MPIRRRLVLYAAGIATAGMILFGALLTGMATNGVGTDQAEALRLVASDVADALEADPSRLDAGPPLIVADLATSLEPFVVLTNESGGVRYATGHVGGEPPRIPAAVIVEAVDTGASAATIRLLGQDFAVHAARWEAGGVAGVVVAGQSFAYRTQQLVGFRALLILSGIVTIVAVVLVTRLVVGRAMRPLRDAAAAADEIARTGDIQRRLPEVKARDEVGRLTTSFNGMLDRLAAAQGRLSGALSAQRRFAADASHELRTPLTTIRTNAEFLASHEDADPMDRTEAIADIAGEAERMSRLVDDLLLLARGDSRAAEEVDGAGGPAPAPVVVRRPVDLGAVLAEVVRRARRPDRSVVLEAVRGAVIIEGDPAELERLAWILVDNALRHGAGTVTVSAEAIHGSAFLRVADEGSGIPSGMEDRAFDRFVRGDPARAGGGSGLGLAIARSIVAGHRGSISAANRAAADGGGAILTVVLPAL